METELEPAEGTGRGLPGTEVLLCSQGAAHSPGAHALAAFMAVGGTPFRTQNTLHSCVYAFNFSPEGTPASERISSCCCGSHKELVGRGGRGSVRPGPLPQPGPVGPPGRERSGLPMAVAGTPPKWDPPELD